MQILLLYTTLIVTDVIAGPATWERVLTKATANGNVVGGVGASEATPGKRPFQVSIQETTWGYGVHFCGGTIYSDYVIITSATCISKYVERPQHLQIVTGDFRLSIVEGQEQFIQVSEVIAHPNYNLYTHENNIALLKLSKPLLINNYTQAMDLPPNKGFQPSGVCTKSGWGSSNVNEVNYSDTMQQIYIPVLSTIDCHDELDSYGFTDTNYIMCAGFRKNEKNTCIGDDGGPLTCLHNGTPYLAGILSYDMNCFDSNKLGVYTSVENYINWIIINAYT